MRKLYLTLLIIVIILVALAIYYFFFSSEPSIIDTILEETQEQESETTTETPSTLTEKTETNASTGGGGGGEEGVGGSGPENPTSITKVNYTLNVDSFPEGLNMITNYSINDISMVFEDSAPYTVLVESGTMACVLLSSNVKGGTVINWLVDGGGECIPYPCSGFTGCGVYMNGPHTVSVHLSTPELE